MAFPTTSVLETFTGTNGTNPPNANWSAVGPLANLQIQSNQAAAFVLGNEDADYWNPGTFGPDCEAFITVATLDAADLDTCGVVARLDPAALNGYLSVAHSANITIERLDGGASTTLATFTQAFSNGDSIGIQIIGSALTAWYKSGAGAWVSLGSTTDSTYTGTGNIGAFINSNALTSTTRMDNFGGGKFVPGTKGIMTTNTGFWGGI